MLSFILGRAKENLILSLADSFLCSLFFLPLSFVCFLLHASFLYLSTNLYWFSIICFLLPAFIFAFSFFIDCCFPLTCCPGLIWSQFSSYIRPWSVTDSIDYSKCVRKKKRFITSECSATVTRKRGIAATVSAPSPHPVDQMLTVTALHRHQLPALPPWPIDPVTGRWRPNSGRGKDSWHVFWTPASR